MVMLHEFEERLGCDDKTVRRGQPQDVLYGPDARKFAACLIFLFVPDFFQPDRRPRRRESGPAGKFLAYCMLDPLESHEKIDMVRLGQNAEIGDQLEDGITYPFTDIRDVLPVEYIIPSELVPHIGHEFQDAVIAVQYALEFLEEHRERQRRS